MAKTLQDILSEVTVNKTLSMFDVLPVHWLENVDDDPTKVRTACERFVWTSAMATMLDPNRTAVHPVTCAKCLAAMADQPVIVGE